MGAIWPQAGIAVKPLADGFIALIKLSITRSEERRVGKECEVPCRSR